MSVSINVAVSGADDFAQELSRFDSAMRTRIQQQLADWAEDVKVEAEQQVPIRTGYLQSTIFAKGQDWQVEMGAEAAYAAAVEFGTVYSRAKPYLAPAMEAHLPILESVLISALEQAKMEAQL